ncbi:hypothetical protein [Streptomyces sp. NPDC008122]|uniref:DUF7507 domain-containing protein n=1 Tax=Streptomyces sp. NPDC008122 TaxID=3364810 RepID=UPI0036E2B558
MSGGLLMAVLLVLPGGVARAGGVGDGALRMTVTVDGRAGTAERPPAVRVGAQVVKRYRLVNRGEAHLYGVRVVDPGVPAGAVSCPRRPLAALGEVECVARLRALPGVHLASARAQGDIPSLGRTIGAVARSGYSGVAGGLALTERVSVTGGRAVIAYVVSNTGNLALHGVRVADTALRLGTVDCGRGGIARLVPGASARCTATVRLPPGTHRSTGLATGSDRVPTYDAFGDLVPAPTVTTRSSAAFTVAAPRVAAAGEGRGGGTGGGAGGASAGAGASTGARGAAGSSGARGAGAGAGGAGSARASGAPGAPRTTGTVGTAGTAGTVGTPGSTGTTGTSGTAGALAGIGSGASSLSGGAPQAAPSSVPRSAPPSPPGAAPPVGRETVPGPPAPPRTDLGTGQRPRVQAVPDNEGLLGRLRRRAREAHEFGVVAMLLLLLIPAALAAALLGNRGN